MNNQEEYLESIEHELNTLNENLFTGNIEFQLNIVNGGIANMNIVKRKSVKLQGGGKWESQKRNQ
jgi:hypothetical protein